MCATFVSTEDERALIMNLYSASNDGFISLTKMCDVKLISKPLKKKLELNTDNIKEINGKSYDYIKSILAMQSADSIEEEENNLGNFHSSKTNHKPIPKKRKLNENIKQLFCSQDSTLNSGYNSLDFEPENFNSEVELIETSGSMDPQTDIIQSSRMSTFQDLEENECEWSILLSGELDTRSFS